MKENQSETGRQFYFPIILTLVSIILGMMSFHAVFPEYPFLRKLYYTFQLFSMESGDRFYERGGQSLFVTIIFNISRFTAIVAIFATIVLAILSALRYKFYQMRLWLMKDHIIICGLGNMGLAIGEKLHDKKKLVIIEKDNTNENIQKLQNEGAIIVEENARDVSLLKKVRLSHARCLVALTGNDFDNLTIIKHALIETSDKSKPEVALSILANIDSRNLKASVVEEWHAGSVSSKSLLEINLKKYYDKAYDIMSGIKEKKDISDLEGDLAVIKKWLLEYDSSIDARRNSMANIILFNKNQLAARYIFLHYPPDRFRPIMKPEDKGMQILMLGTSQIGEELLRLFAQNCHYLNRKKTRITMICLNGDTVEERTLSKYPTLWKIIDLRCIKQNPHHLTRQFLEKNDISSVDAIYVCSGEDRLQASYSSRAREIYGDEIPIVRPFYQTTVLAEEKTIRNIWSFNVLGEISDIEQIIDRNSDRKAMTIHNHWLQGEIKAYVRKVDDCIGKNLEIPSPKPTMVPWNMAPGEIHDDNRSVVDHINIKLRSFGQLMDHRYYSNPKETTIDLSFLDDPLKVNQLAEMEHRRWMANKYLCGWEYGVYRNENTKKHESLIDFEDLDENVREIDIRQIQNLKEIIDLV